jgi:Putative prokaryotic signal transducing protein
MTRLTSIYGSFRARVVAARLESEGIDVELRGALDSPYAVTVGELARVDVFVPEDQADDASLVLLVDEVDETDVILDDDRPPVAVRRVPRWCVGVALLLLAIAAVPAAHIVHQAIP